MEITHSQILIIGAGPVGLALGCMFRLQGLDVRIIEKNSTTTPFSKAVGIHSRTLEQMHALGIADKLVSQGRPLTQFSISESNQKTLSASFENIGSPYEFVLGLPQSKTESTLHARFIELGGSVEWETEIISIEDCGCPKGQNSLSEVVIRLPNGEKQKVTSHWLFGADGSRSSVREMADIAFPGGSYEKGFMLGDIKIDWDGDKDHLQFFLSKHGYLLLIPMPNGMHRVIAQTENRYEDFQKTDKPVATLQDLQAIVDRNGPGGIKLHSPEWLTCAPFYHRCAAQVRKGRILLAGDSFHLFSPLGAQGLNTGFQDVFNIGWKVAFYEKGWGDLTLIDSYQTERQAIADLVAKVTSKTTNYITSTAWHKRLLRKCFTLCMNNTDKVQHTLPKLMAGMLQKYSVESLLVGKSGHQIPQAGERFPHAWIPQDEGYSPICDFLNGPEFTFVLVTPHLTDKAINHLHKIKQSLVNQIPFIKIMVIAPKSNEISKLPSSIQFVEDRLGSMCNLAANGHEASLLVRPDGICALTQNNWEQDSVTEYFTETGLLKNITNQLKAA
ncbi:FAD-dependent monooxygenase [Neptuniibacter sp. QD34_54]|uniref:FAD-dependent monooxygenase n=1 Tax=Neptuniibacter sp. QD34_54 TaxID=3398208 RepID=UPI0039F57C05